MKAELKVLTTEEDFVRALYLDLVIIYLQVDWSGPEMVSRRLIADVLGDIQPVNIPVFKIESTDQKQYVVDWLFLQSDNVKHFAHGGWGETLFIQKGKLIDYMTFPAHLGLEAVKSKLVQWTNYSPAGNSKLPK